MIPGTGAAAAADSLVAASGEAPCSAVVRGVPPQSQEDPAPGNSRGPTKARPVACWSPPPSQCPNQLSSPYSRRAKPISRPSPLDSFREMRHYPGPPRPAVVVAEGASQGPCPRLSYYQAAASESAGARGSATGAGRACCSTPTRRGQGTPRWGSPDTLGAGTGWMARTARCRPV